MGVNLMLRECSSCHELLPLSEYYPMTVRMGDYLWRGYRAECRECALTRCKVNAYIKRIKTITSLSPYESPSERALREYRERIESIGELPIWYSAEERRLQKNEWSRKDWWGNRQANVERKRAYNAREDVKRHQREWETEYRQTPRGRAIWAAKEGKRRAQKRATQTEDLAWFYGSVRGLPLVLCHICGSWLPGSECHIDHVVPLARGGSHTKDNLATACPSCNLRKNARLDWKPTPARAA